MKTRIIKRIITVVMTMAIAFTFSFGMMSSDVQAASRPQAGKILKASSSYTSVTLKWKKTSRTTGYLVYRYSGGKYKKIKTIKKKSTCSYKNTKLTSGKTYKYYVKSYRKVGKRYIYGKRSAVKSVTTKKYNYPTNITGTDTKDIGVGYSRYVKDYYKVSPSNCINKSVTVTSDNPEIVSVENGILYGNSEGETYINIKAKNNVSYKFRITCGYDTNTKVRTPLTVAGKTIRIGDTLDQVISTFGQPDESNLVDPNKYSWYIFNGNTKNLLMAGIRNNKVVAYYTCGDDFSYDNGKVTNETTDCPSRNAYFDDYTVIYRDTLKTQKAYAVFTNTVDIDQYLSEYPEEQQDIFCKNWAIEAIYITNAIRDMNGNLPFEIAQPLMEGAQWWAGEMKARDICDHSGPKYSMRVSQWVINNYRPWCEEYYEGLSEGITGGTDQIESMHLLYTGDGIHRGNQFGKKKGSIKSGGFIGIAFSVTKSHGIVSVSEPNHISYD